MWSHSAFNLFSRDVWDDNGDTRIIIDIELCLL